MCSPNKDFSGYFTKSEQGIIREIELGILADQTTLASTEFLDWTAWLPG